MFDGRTELDQSYTVSRVISQFSMSRAKPFFGHTNKIP